MSILKLVIITILSIIIVVLFKYLFDTIFVGKIYATNGIKKKRIHLYRDNMNNKHASVRINGRYFTRTGYYSDPLKTLAKEDLDPIGWKVINNAY